MPYFRAFAGFRFILQNLLYENSYEFSGVLRIIGGRYPVLDDHMTGSLDEAKIAAGKEIAFVGAGAVFAADETIETKHCLQPAQAFALADNARTTKRQMPKPCCIVL